MQATTAPTTFKDRLRSLPLTLQMILAVLLGTLTGVLAGPSAGFLGDPGAAMVQLIKTFSTPLLFFVILHAVLSHEIRMQKAGKMLGVAFTNGIIALSIGLALSNFFQPGKLLPLHPGDGSSPTPTELPAKLDFSQVFTGMVPKSIFAPFVENSVLGAVVLALFIGFAIRRSRDAHLKQLIDGGLKVFETILAGIIRFAPFAVFCVTAKIVGEKGLVAFRGLGAYVGIGLLGFALHSLITYNLWIRFIFRKSVRTFWKEAIGPVTYAFGANSSLATLPLTLKSLRNLGVSEESSALGACVGTNFNNDGIILYEAMAVLMIAQAYGMSLTAGEQLQAAATCLVAAAGVAGVPEAGFISLTLVVGTLGLPTESLPLLLSVDWILARARSSVNVLSDMIVSMGIEFTGRSRT